MTHSAASPPMKFENETTGAVRTIALLGNHVPRQCGIATFTTDLSDAIALELPESDVFVVAMNDVGRRHAYPPRVRFELPENELAAYRRAASFLNLSGADVLCVQHEYGIFGGTAGAHLLALLREVRMPIVTTLHTLLSEPDDAQRRVMDEIVRLSERLVVMSDHGASLLRDVHGVPDRRIDRIPHGIASLPLLPRGKRPARRRRQVGHPHLRAALAGQGHRVRHRRAPAHPRAAPRHGLRRARRDAPAREGARRRDVPHHARVAARAASACDGAMIFHDRFVSRERARRVPLRRGHLHHALPQARADRLGDARVRGRLRAGRSSRRRTATRASSSPTGAASWSRGEIPAAIAREVIGLLGDDAKRAGDARARRGLRRAACSGPPSRAATSRASSARTPSTPTAGVQAAVPRSSVERLVDLPEVDLQHLRRMTDDTGMLQHGALQRAPLRGRLLPRRQRARAAAHGAWWRTRAARRPRPCAGWRRATSPS